MINDQHYGASLFCFLGSPSIQNNIVERRNPHVYQMLCPGFAHPDFKSYSHHYTLCIIKLTQHQMGQPKRGRTPLPFTIIRIIYLLHGNCCDDQESNPQCYRTHFAGFLDYQMRWDAEMKRFASSFSDRLGYRRIILDVQQTESSPQ